MALTCSKGKDRQKFESEDEEEITFEVDDVSTWLNEDTCKTPPSDCNAKQIDDLLKSSPPSPLFYQRVKKEEITLPKPPDFKTEEDIENEPKIHLTKELDLDASVDAIFSAQRKVMKRKKKEDDKPVMMECPICSRMFLKEKIEIHASDCTGAYSESEEEEEEVVHGKRKKTMASGIAKSEAIRQKRYKNVQQIPINYYLASDDMVATDGGDFASSSSGLQWESAGQTRFS